MLRVDCKCLYKDLPSTGFHSAESILIARKYFRDSPKLELPLTEFIVLERISRVVA